MRKVLLILFILNVIVISVVMVLTKNQVHEDELDLLKSTFSKKHLASVNHKKFFEDKKFKTPQEVTRECLHCHTERGKEMLATSHWKWTRQEYIKERDIVDIGKKNIINNYCIGIGGSEQSCNMCHAGFGWKDNSFDFSKQENIDCMVCHDNSGEYAKQKGEAGYPEPTVNLTKVAINVGLPKRGNCGSCHFFGGGGNTVKDGDLEKVQLSCTKDVDVHMSYEGGDLQCSDCHRTKNHNITGKLYSVSSMNHNRVTCVQCHGKTPHEENIINEHTVKVSCQACHIPTYAKVNSTKLTWDWSTAGKLKKGEPYEEDDSLGNHTYLSIKGTFTWGRNIEPEYAWHNGTADHYFLGDKVDTSHQIKLNTLFGSYGDPDAQIIPVKVHRGIQPYDPVLDQLISPKLFANQKGEGGYWKDFDWNTAAARGMAHIGQKYSGKYTFVHTEMYWPVNHMVSPAEKAVSCTECHSKNGRLQKLTDFYLPGRDENATIEFLGIGAILTSIIGVFIHALMRIMHYYRRKNQQL